MVGVQTERFRKGSPARRVADSGAKAHQALGGGHERLRWPVENGYDRRDQLGVGFKRAPVAPTILRSQRTALRAKYGKPVLG